MVQIDGSPHAWFEDRGLACSLLVYVDDATGRSMELRFVEAVSALRRTPCDLLACSSSPQTDAQSRSFGVRV